MNHKLSLGLAMLPLVPAVQAQEQGRQDGERPNIIFIMSDDHAQQAMSIYGHPIGKVAPTPNIDRIGQEGAVFWNNYCCNSISGPSRAAILTGKHSHKNGFMKNWALGSTALSRRCLNCCNKAAMRLPSSVNGILFPSRRDLTIG